MVVGGPKQKWTPEEEEALRAGVLKHGIGKWRIIQRDPQFSSVLFLRSNVDLKDKWRNMNIGSGGRDKILRLVGKETVEEVGDEPLDQSMALVVAGEHPLEDTTPIHDIVVSPDSSEASGEKFENLVFEAIHKLRETNGSGINTIANYIEEQLSKQVPSNFRRFLSGKLGDMASEGKLIKLRQNFKLNNGFSPFQHGNGNGKHVPPQTGKAMVVKRPREVARGNTHLGGERRLKKRAAPVETSSRRLRLKTQEEAARAAALAVAEAEAAAAAAVKAAEEAEAAEAEAEAAERAAEMAAAAAQSPKKCKESNPFPRGMRKRK